MCGVCMCVCASVRARACACMSRAARVRRAAGPHSGCEVDTTEQHPAQVPCRVLGHTEGEAARGACVCMRACVCARACACMQRAACMRHATAGTRCAGQAGGGDVLHAGAPLLGQGSHRTAIDDHRATLAPHVSNLTDVHGIARGPRQEPFPPPRPLLPVYMRMRTRVDATRATRTLYIMPFVLHVGTSYTCTQLRSPPMSPSWQVREDLWVARLEVHDTYRHEKGIYNVSMQQVRVACRTAHRLAGTGGRPYSPASGAPVDFSLVQGFGACHSTACKLMRQPSCNTCSLKAQVASRPGLAACATAGLEGVSRASQRIHALNPPPSVAASRPRSGSEGTTMASVSACRWGWGLLGVCVLCLRCHALLHAPHTHATTTTHTHAHTHTLHSIS